MFGEKIQIKYWRGKPDGSKVETVVVFPTYSEAIKKRATPPAPRRGAARDRALTTPRAKRTTPLTGRARKGTITGRVPVGHAR
jgi:hypothetical protein